MTVKSPAVVLVLQLMDLTEMVQLYFQEEVVEAKIQVVEVDSEDKVSLEMDFLLSENQSNPVNISHNSNHIHLLLLLAYCSARPI